MAWLHFRSVVWSLEVSYDLAPGETFFFSNKDPVNTETWTNFLSNEGFRFLGNCAGDLKHQNLVSNKLITKLTFLWFSRSPRVGWLLNLARPLNLARTRVFCLLSCFSCCSFCFYLESIGSVVVRALASHQCGATSISRLGVICGWVSWFSSLLWEVFLRVLRFSPLLKNLHLIKFDLY